MAYSNGSSCFTAHWATRVCRCRVWLMDFRAFMLLILQVWLQKHWGLLFRHENPLSLSGECWSISSYMLTAHKGKRSPICFMQSCSDWGVKTSPCGACETNLTSFLEKLGQLQPLYYNICHPSALIWTAETLGIWWGGINTQNQLVQRCSST